MSDDKNGRVTIAVLGNKLDSVLATQILTNANVADMRHEMSLLRQDLAVNQERWQNHKDLHKRERTLLATLSAALSTAGAVISVWWNSKLL